MVKDLLWDNHH